MFAFLSKFLLNNKKKGKSYLFDIPTLTPKKKAQEDLCFL